MREARIVGEVARGLKLGRAAERKHPLKTFDKPGGLALVGRSTA